MQFVLASVRPAASRLACRSSSVAPSAAPSHSRSVHSASAPSSATSAAASKPASKPTAPTASKLATPGQDLYTWGGGSSWYSRATSSSASRSSVLTTLLLRPTPMVSPDGTGFRDISFGHKHAAFITGSGQLYTYGSGPALGHGPGVVVVDTPRRVEGLPPVVEVRCGQAHTVVLTADGEVYSFGKGAGFLGRFGTPSPLGFSKDAPRPERVNVDGQRIVQIASGSQHVMVRTDKGQLYGFGNGANGRLGTGSSASEVEPVLISALADYKVTHVSCGSSFNGALTEDGSVWCWGRNEKGQLGVGTGLTLDQYGMEVAPAHVDFDEEGVVISRLSCAYKHTLALDTSGRVYLWGQSKWLKPNLQSGDDGWMVKERFIDVAGGQGFSAAVKQNGMLFTWGDGSNGCLGHNSTASVKDPLAVRGFGPTPKDAGVAPDQWMGRVTQVLAGHNHCAVLTTKK